MRTKSDLLNHIQLKMIVTSYYGARGEPITFTLIHRWLRSHSPALWTSSTISTGVLRATMSSIGSKPSFIG